MRRQKAAAAPPVPAVHPARVDNPDWVALNRQLGDLQQQRVKLLVDRTPIHPEVQQTELRIAEIQRRLAETQRWIPARQSGGESSLPLAAAQPAAQTAVPAEDPFVTRVALEKLKEAVAAARRASQQAAASAAPGACRPASESRGSSCNCAVPQAALPPLAGAAAAAGPGRLGGRPDGHGRTGHGRHRRGHRAGRQLGGATPRILTVPVLGVVPETSPAKAARSGRPNLLRLLWIAAGLIVIASCAGGRGAAAEDDGHVRNLLQSEPAAFRLRAAGGRSTIRPPASRPPDRPSRAASSGPKASGWSSGPAGTGKTLLCQLLAEQLHGAFQVVLLSSGRLGTRRALAPGHPLRIGTALSRHGRGRIAAVAGRAPDARATNAPRAPCCWSTRPTPCRSACWTRFAP